MADFNIKLFKDKMEITNTKTGNIDIVKPSKSFSNNRLLIASVTSAIECLQQYLKENNKSFIKPKLTFTPMEINKDYFSEAEVMIIQNVAYQAGAREVVINKE
jgi:hypothetical protein